MFVIGIDPHKGSRTAAVIDDGEQVVGGLRIDAGRRQADRLRGFAAPFRPRTWAVEAAGGLAAITQVAHDTPGRAYYDRKLADGKSRKEALRALKRRISDAVYRQLRADSHR